MASLTEMDSINKTQKDLLDFLYNKYGCVMYVCTHKIAQDRGDCQGYESYLRDRLFRLSYKGWIRAVEIKSVRGNVVRRNWMWTDRGALLML